MSFKQGLIYVLKNCWFWIWKLYLRPLDVIEDAKTAERKWSEVSCAAISGGIWGTIIGVVHWKITGDIHAVWILAVVVVAVAVAVAVAYAHAFADAVDSALTVAFAYAFAGALAVAGSVAVAVAGAGTLAIAVAVAIAYSIAVAYAGALVVAVAVVIVFDFSVVVALTYDFSVAVVIAVIVAVAGIITGYFFANDSIYISIQKRTLEQTVHRQSTWLIFFWTFFSVLALIAWFSNPKTPELSEKLKLLAIFFVVGAPLFTGLPFYPFTALISLWQYSDSWAKKHTIERFRLKIPFRWQTFAYPLPGFTFYLIRLAQEHGCETAFKSIQELQFRTLQMLAGRLAILELARGKHGLSFCGYVAEHCSVKTLISLSLAGNISRAVSVLRRKIEKESEQPLQLYAGDFPPPLPWLPPIPSWIDEFIRIREQSLSNRIAYASEQLSKSDPIPDHAGIFRFILNKLAEYAGATDLKTTLSAIRPLEVIDLSDKETKWMTGGRSLLTDFYGLMEELKAYWDLTTPTARKEFLNRKAESLKQHTWDNLPDYWASIGKELSEHWIHLLDEEAKQAKEWLKLDITASQNRIATGRQELLLNIKNPTGTLAKNVRIRMDDEPGIFWNIRQAQSSFLEGGKDTTLKIELETQQQGRFRIAGILEAEDLDDNPVKQPFAFSVEASERGKSYQIPQFQPYQAGEGLGDDRTFAGRIELIHELKSLWKQPGGKPAIALVGQRRIGKTSLLNKIARMGLEDIGLLPVLTDIQGIGTEYEFVKETARKMSEALGLPVPHIGQTEPFAEFGDVLLGMKSAAKERRILLMLDEADLIPAKRLGERVPDFLRSVMQSPEYPILLLFCGTHALSRMSRDQSSILFNTVHFKTVSYLTKSESAEVLVKPAKDIIEFDPIVLDEAFRLTRGQPQLLQSLGMAMINNFNSVIFSGKTRSDYADLNDLNQAAETVLQQHNSAFTQHWEHADIATHRVLSALAWALDETNRPQMDIDGIEDMMRQTRLQLNRERTFRILEQLSEEEFLIGEGVTYRFAVPLYRRWIAWRWQPEKVRQEG